MTQNHASRSVSIGGNVQNTTIVTGDCNQVHADYRTNQAAPEDIDLHTELQALKALLADLALPQKERTKLDNALQEATLESEADEPDLEEVGDAMTRVMKAAGKAEAFTEKAETLLPRLKNLANLLGSYGVQLMPFLGC